MSLFPVLRVYVATFGVLFSLISVPAVAVEISVAVSSNFAVPLERIASLYQKQSGHTIKVNSGSSGKLYEQIVGGVPFDLFLSADENFPKRLIQEGFAVPGSRFVYAQGQLVLWSAQPDLVDAKGFVLRNGVYSKLALPDPRYAPYGVAAKATLEKLAMWNGLQRKLEKGENVELTYQMAATENVDLAFVSISQVMRDGKMVGGSWWLVPPELHSPIRQSAILLSGAQEPQAAQAFLNFIKSPKVTAIIRGFGYELP